MLLAIIACVYLLVGIGIAQRRRPLYRWQKDTISELGETGAHDARLVNYFIFLPVGLILLGIPAMHFLQESAQGYNSPLIGLTGCVGVGYVLAAFFPCDPGSPATGTSRQTVHTLGGFVEYAGGAYFLSQAGENFKYAGIVVMGCAVLISFNTPWRGAIQRVAEILLFSGILLMSMGQAL